MLVLARKKGESIMIGEQIEIVVVEVVGDTVRLGIRAPKDVEIYRKEVYLSIQQSNKEAAESVVDLHSLKSFLSSHGKKQKSE